LGDLILVPKTIHQVFNLGTSKPTKGKHGFDNKEVDMRASFMAWGPAFKNGLMIEGFENVHVYPLVANLLGLNFNEQAIDGKFEVLKPILKNK
jgi:predicted AlkP superfamily pyrophosphatase or phosphodiesterase